jgi:nucleoid DNA-binding protein
MVIEIIAKYLESNKRLVVPNLGTFIVKVPAQTILFSNLIKNDDGVLRSLLHQSGISELDAAALIDKFVFEVNYRLDNSQVCALDGFGILRTGANGTISFTYNPMAKGEVLDGGASERLAEIEAQRATTVTEEEPQIEDDDEGDVVIDIAPRLVAEPSVVVEQTAVVEQAATTEPKATEPKIAERRTERRRNDSDYVKGLRYGKGHKVVTGREGATSRKSSKSDLVIKIAIVAAVIAILALAYGFWNDMRNHKFMYEGLYDEQSVYDDTSSVEQGVRNPDLDYITPNQN